MAHFNGDDDKRKRDEIIDEYYTMTLVEINQGASLEKIRDILKKHEKEELYLECEGIKRALEDATFAILKIITEEIKSEDLINKINIDYDEEEN